MDGLALTGNGTSSVRDGQAKGTAGADDPSGASEVMGALRDLGRQVEAIGKQLPTAQAEMQQLRQILKRLVIKAGQSAPKATPSAQRVPGGAS